MIYIIGSVVVAVVLWVAVALRVEWRKKREKGYYEITLLLGSGGHTGELCEMLHNFKLERVNRLNVLITSTDRASEGFFTNYIKRNHAPSEPILEKVRVYYVSRTNEVKQWKVTACLTALRSLISAFLLVATQLINSTHFISNGPGTSVPLFYCFFLLRAAHLSRAKLIFIESWCRVKDLSLSGKLVRPVADEFVVHWPELAGKYKGCRYYQGIF